jgi:hypothetical protein
MARQPQGDELGRINPFSSRSCNWVLSSISSFGGIRYDLLEIGAVPGFNSQILHLFLEAIQADLSGKRLETHILSEYLRSPV